MRNDFFGEMAETGGVPLNASPVRRWAGVFGHRPFAFLSRGRLRRAAARTVAEQSELLRRTAPWLKDAAIPGTYAGAAAYRDEASRITLDHVRKPFQERIDRLSGRLAGERFNQRFAERLERNLDAARTLKPRRHRIRHTR